MVLAWLTEQAAAQRSRVFLWTPVAFGAGAAVYLSLSREPQVWVGCAVLGFAALILFVVHRRAMPLVWQVPALLCACASAGFLMAILHSLDVAAPVAPTGLGARMVEGWVTEIDTPSARGERVVLAPIHISGLDAPATPVRVRIVIPASPEGVPPPGSAIRVLALVDPPPGPAAPGAYDFAQTAWFRSLGAVGLALKPPEFMVASPPPPAVQWEMAVNGFRWAVAGALARSVHDALGSADQGASGLAAAVATSHQDWLGPEGRDDLRNAGLAHMLAIAGLHTAAVSGFAFFAVRFLAACWPWLALRVSTRKLAAATAILVVWAYLLLSGAHPPARRAAITATIAFMAILLDRRPVSLHALAAAALVVLALEPQSVLDPGFEMSFCATAALLAVAEAWPPHTGSLKGVAWPKAIAVRAGRYLAGLFSVSLIAGAATSPFAIQHFNRVANYGFVANLAADFVASVVLMPTLVITAIVHAIAPDSMANAAAVTAAGAAAQAIMTIGHEISNAPGAVWALASAPTIALGLSYLGLILLCLWRGPLRWLGAPLALAVALWPRPAPPLAWLAADGADAAVVVNGAATAMKPGKRAYAVGAWTQQRGLRFIDDESGEAAARLWDCNRMRCLPIGSTRPAIAGWWRRKAPDPEQWRALCQGADVVILEGESPATDDCAALVLNGATFARLGAAEISPGPRGWRLVWAQPLRGERPWSRQPERFSRSDE